MKAYPAYKDSGVEWLGDVPDAWGVSQLRRFLATVFNGTTATQVEQSEDTVPVTRIETISDGTVNHNKTGHIPSGCAPEQMRLARGDILFSHINSLSMIGNCALFDGSLELYAGMNLLTLRPNRAVQPQFLNWLLQSPDLKKYISSLAKPAINQASLPQSHLLNIRLAHPSLSEQRAIAAFLDREVAKIDGLIEEQRRLIALLAEKRQATISHAVTKGLNPNAKLKPSGIDWLGDVPEGWDVVRVKAVVDQVTSGPRGWSEFLGGGRAVFFQSQNIGRDMEIVLEEASGIDPPQDNDAARARLRTDDVVVCITGARTGAVSHVRETTKDAYINQHVCLLRPRPSKVLGRFLAYSLFSRHGQEQLTAGMYGLKQGLGLEQLRNHVIALPTLDDQIQIAEWLDGIGARFASLSQQSHEAITLLQERRSALISAAVTGKIDVRDVAPDMMEPA